MSAPAGWYDDGSGRQRWWDGSAWGVYAQDVSSAQMEVRPVGYGEVGTPVAQSADGPGMLGRLGRAVKGAALEQREVAQRRRREREEREQEARRRQEELDRQAGALVTSGVFGDAHVEIFENGYVRISESLTVEISRRQERLNSLSSRPVRHSQSLNSMMSSLPYEKLLSISFSRGGVVASQPDPMSDIVKSTTMKAVGVLAKGGSGVLKASVPGVAIAGVGYLAKKVVTGKSVLTIATDRQIHTLTNRAVVASAGIPLIKKDQEDVGEILERVGNSVLTALGCGPVGSNVPALPSGQVEIPQGGTPAVSSADVAERIRDLAALRKDGILDDSEYFEAKRKLLGKL
ncbi:DUF2510 domain-containing protein [Actinomyces sp. ZJ308]|uniref:DUF2510 domain-containing protein n=1 Tax=Actinomyces sp. ZJ308 TaxID=2708342 RepID=UPI00141DEC87|nr:DUF2510 domain-containing protein [Actinomyces sp. ZJ308]